MTVSKVLKSVKGEFKIWITENSDSPNLINMHIERIGFLLHSTIIVLSREDLIKELEKLKNG